MALTIQKHYYLRYLLYHHSAWLVAESLKWIACGSEVSSLGKLIALDGSVVLSVA